MSLKINDAWKGTAAGWCAFTEVKGKAYDAAYAIALTVANMAFDAVYGQGKDCGRVVERELRQDTREEWRRR